MAEIKTKQHDGSVEDFIREFANSEQKIADSFELLKLMEEVSGYKPKMWGPSIIGFGKYHYKSERSTQEGIGLSWDSLREKRLYHCTSTLDVLDRMNCSRI